jgi:small subunit ribosomal protein S1
MSAERIMSAEGEMPDSVGQGKDSMAEMFERYLSSHCVEQGQVVSGTVVRVGSNEIVVDVRAKCEGIVPERDLERLSREERDAIHVGDEIFVYILNPEDANGNIILSLSRAQTARDWQEARRLLESQEIIERRVTGYNRGGVIAHVGRVRGFVPGSQLTPLHTVGRSASGMGGEERWAGVVGEILRLKVIEVDQKRNRLILSERAAMRDWQKRQRETLLNELTEGDVRRGRVINLVDFGAFVDLGGMDGLVHLSELSWRRVSHPREVVEVGQEVEVYVLEVDRERERIALSFKRLQPDPWSSVEERYHEGQLIEATITRITKWGAFASIVGDEAIEGLIHVSELDDGPVAHPSDIVSSGEVVVLRVIGVDGARHRLALSLKQAAAEEYMAQDWEAALAAQQPESEGSLSAAFSKASVLGESLAKGREVP